MTLSADAWSGQWSRSEDFYGAGVKGARVPDDSQQLKLVIMGVFKAWAYGFDPPN